MSSDIAIKVENLSKCYQIYDKPRDRLLQMLARGRRQYFREFWALKDVSFEVKKGETVGIVGRNGSGKSTLLQMICGTLNPTSGGIHTNGRIAALLELGSGFNPEFTGRENVYMNGEVLGLGKSEIDSRFDDIAKFADINDFIDQPSKTYSSGMYIRLAFAVAINVDPDILIVDEALSVGDIRFQAKCLRAIQEIKEKGASILFVTHSTGQIEALCSRAIWLNDGLLKADAPPKHLMRNYVNFMVHGIDEKDSSHDSTETKIINPREVLHKWIHITEKNNVKGSLSANIHKVCITQGNGNTLDIVSSQTQDINVAFEVKVHSHIYKPIVAIGIFNELNEPIIHFNTENTKKHIPELQANTHCNFDYNFNIPALKPGDYLISVGIDDGITGASNILCHVYDAWSFTVILPNNVKPQGGYIQVENIKEEITNIGA